MKLDIEWCCIFQYHFFFQSCYGNLQSKQGSIFPHIKTPFVWITDEGNLFGQQNSAIGKTKFIFFCNFLVRN